MRITIEVTEEKEYEIERLYNCEMLWLKMFYI